MVESPPFHLNWTTQLRKGLLELAILNALSARPLYGYDIVRQLGDIDSLVISEGTIYPILTRLRAEKYVESFTEDSPDGPPRKYYRLTAAGQEQLRRMNDHWKRLRNAIEALRKEGSS
jgi:PadR family transcriptional regulator PadR